jgi:hypothetical protein
MSIATLATVSTPAVPTPAVAREPAVRGLLIPADVDQPLRAVSFTADDRGGLPLLRELLGASLTRSTVLTPVDFVAGHQDDADEINPRARAAAAALIYSVAHGQFTVPGVDRLRARRVLAGEIELPHLRGPVVVLGVSLLDGNFATAPEELISFLLDVAECLEPLGTALAHLYEGVAC